MLSTCHKCPSVIVRLKNPGSKLEPTDLFHKKEVFPVSDILGFSIYALLSLITLLTLLSDWLILEIEAIAILGI